MKLFAKKWIIIASLILLLFFQLVYGFLNPSVGSSDNWQPISSYLAKFDARGSDNLLLVKGLSLVSPEYRLNSDVGHYLELARDFSPEYFEGSPFLERPLYPFLIFLASLPVRVFTPASYGVIFASSILVNFILISAAVILFFFLLRNIFSLKVAWLSSVLLIFSPFVHSYISQPLAEMLMAFSVVLAAFLLYNYAKNPSWGKLILFSLLIGALMLGKMFFAISFFILLLAVYFRRYREGLAFLGLHLAPFMLWYLWVTGVWGIAYRFHQTQDWGMGVWVFSIFKMPWPEAYRALISPLPNFITALFYAFLLIPAVFSVIGLQKVHLKSKNVIYFGALLSVFALGFLAKFYYIRHVFLLFPVIYPTAVLGMESAASRLRGRYLKLIFYFVVMGGIILISSVNIYQVFNYNH